MKSKWILKHNKDHCTIVNEGGKNIGYQPNAGVQIMEEDGFGFKDLNGSGRLDARPAESADGTGCGRLQV